MTYELINPSDKMTATGDFDLIGMGLAVFMLGEGFYALNDQDGKTVVPIVAFGGSAEGWFRANGTTMDGAVLDKSGEASDFLNALHYHSERSSLNDIGKRAKWLAGKLRELATSKSKEARNEND